tara:strand:- start:46 stop:1065 length:1020 start_codon:yes stop_codon:yes gene_type:complete
MNITDIEERFAAFKPKRQTTTNHQYGLQISKISKDLSITDTVQFLETDKIQEYLKVKSFSAQANANNAIMEYLKTFSNSDYEETIAFYKSQKELSYLIYHKNQGKGIFIGKQAENVISFDELMDYYHNICKIVKTNEYDKKPCIAPINGSSSPAIDYLNLRLLLRLYVLHPSRNEYATLEMISQNDYDKIQHPLKNYLVYAPQSGGSYLSINVYKMSAKYGVKKILIEDKELKSLIRFHKKKFGFGTMFKKQNGTDHDNASLCTLMTGYSRKHVGKSIGSTLIYKICIGEVSKKYKVALEKEDMEFMEKYKGDLEEFAKTRGHSFATQQQIYAKEIDGE